MKHFFFKLILLTVNCLFVVYTFASISGGQISLKSNSLYTVGKTCLQSCSPSYSDCYFAIWEYTAPVGGSGQYEYSWETKQDNGPWISINGYPTNRPYYDLLQPPQQKGVKYYYRRKTKDLNNSADSAYSNEVFVTTWTNIHGTLRFTDYSQTNVVPVGTQPLLIENNSWWSDCYATWTFWEEKVGINGSWHDVSYYALYQNPNNHHQPPSRNTPDTVYYRDYIDNACGDYDTTYTNTVKVIFQAPIVFDPGNISSNITSACPGTSVKLTSTPTNAPLPYTSSYQYSTDTTTWFNLCTNCDTATDNNFNQSRYYRRVVKSGFTTLYSTRIKVTAVGPSGIPSIIGNRRWNVYCYNGNDLSLGSNLDYRGVYFDSVGIKTTDQWPDQGSPSDAVGYLGCLVSPDNFTIQARRRNFDTGLYVVRMPVYNGSVQLLKNSSPFIHTFSCCNSNSTFYIGRLSATDTMEIRYASGTGSGALQINFVKVLSKPVTNFDSACTTYYSQYLYKKELVYLTDSIGAPVIGINSDSIYLDQVTCNMKHSGPGAINIPKNNDSIRYLPRYFNLNSDYSWNAFPRPVTVRLFFLNSEFDNYKQAVSTPSLTLADLRVLHYNGTTTDCNINNNQPKGNVLTPIAFGSYGTEGFYLDVQDTTLGEMAVFAPGQLVPVRWIAFNAIKQDNSVRLSWKIQETSLAASFQVERSDNAVVFYPIGHVEGHSVSVAPAEYTFTDNKPFTRNVYYRIKRTDVDGTSSYSTVVRVEDATTQLSLHPNPVQNIAILTSSRQIKRIVLRDMRGRSLQVDNPESATATINTSNLSPGLYMLSILLEDGQVQTLKMLKQ